MYYLLLASDPLEPKAIKRNCIAKGSKEAMMKEAEALYKTLYTIDFEWLNSEETGYGVWTNRSTPVTVLFQKTDDYFSGGYPFYKVVEVK